MSAQSIRPAAVAGAFYAADANSLRRDVRSYLDAAPATRPAGDVVAIIVPHAGYHYSAAVAAYGYRALEGQKFDTAIVIGHDAHASGIVAILSDAEAFETPLGRVAVDTELVAALAKAHPGIIIRNQVHSRDHTVEVQLPFLQTVVPGCRIVPALFGEPNPENCRRFAAAIASQAGARKLLIIASSDLSHYPPREPNLALDRQTMAQVQTMDVPALFTHLQEAVQRGTADNVQTAMCASGGVGTALTYAQAGGPASVSLLRTANSGDVPDGDASRVVGYAAAVVWRKAPAGAPAAVKTQAQPDAGRTDATFALAPEVQAELLRLARRRIVAAVRRESLDYQPPPALKEALERRSPVFVTLHKAGRLRGCIGMTEARLELWRAVQEMALSAACKDWRFQPVTEAELDTLHIEISVLSPLVAVNSADDIIPKQHGVVIRRDGHSGLFLPQVWEQLPDRDQFLSVLCSEKAGLPENAWKDQGTRLFVFTVFAFEEP